MEEVRAAELSSFFWSPAHLLNHEMGGGELQRIMAMECRSGKRPILSPFAAVQTQILGLLLNVATAGLL